MDVWITTIFTLAVLHPHFTYCRGSSDRIGEATLLHMRSYKVWVRRLYQSFVNDTMGLIHNLQDRIIGVLMKLFCGEN